MRIMVIKIIITMFMFISPRTRGLLNIPRLKKATEAKKRTGQKKYRK